MADPVPKPPAFDAATFENTLYAEVTKDDGTPYQVFKQFRPWKVWADKLRDRVEANRVQLGDHKKDIDQHSAEVADLTDRVAALEAQPMVPFPGSS